MTVSYNTIIGRYNYFRASGFCWLVLYDRLGKYYIDWSVVTDEYIYPISDNSTSYMLL